MGSEYWYGFVQITTGDFSEYYEIYGEKYGITSADNVPPTGYSFHIHCSEHCNFIKNYSNRHTFYYLQRLINNSLIRFVCDEYIPSDTIDVWII